MFTRFLSAAALAAAVATSEGCTVVSNEVIKYQREGMEVEAKTLQLPVPKIVTNAWADKYVAEFEQTVTELRSALRCSCRQQARAEFYKMMLLMTYLIDVGTLVPEDAKFDGERFKARVEELGQPLDDLKRELEALERHPKN